MKSKVDYEFIRAWALDLETTTAPQVQGTLCAKVGRRWGYCCLGRAEVVAGTKSCVVNTVDGQTRFFGDDGDTTATLTEQTASRLNSIDSDPKIRVPKKFQKKTKGLWATSAVGLNDSFGFTFKEIAACIRYTWPRAFK